jgi:hypothetical protein
MSLKLFSPSDKLAVIEEIIIAERHKAKANGTSARGARRYEILKSIAEDLRSRQDMTRSNPLGELERQLRAVVGSKTSLGYSATTLQAVGNAVVNKWPFISQALERFGEESAE